MPTPKDRADLFDASVVRELADILNETGLSEIEVERDGLKVRVAKTLSAATTVYAPAPAGAVVSPSAAAPTAAAAVVDAAQSGDVVKSPMVGTVYLQAQPGAPPFANIGDTVAEGQTLLLIEAMKTMNPISAPRAGKVLEFLVGDAQPVEYGEPLVVLG
jgi:acetyl-CoA carboxylase biotin carboxyl carrier protein